ncbi:PREDICTED: G-protein coupled receptor moody-like [Branchiostoma belcheri]|uniref:G-protein coupled receptor moody-like n=1 Tax=Branchiostoma belcheri TaxID=7741 RepID=A0A6P4XVG6_BRABE|nr:PREDICTED: G-protein coupled receptor moody-like [Branchiostoma belcheri]
MVISTGVYIAAVIIAVIVVLTVLGCLLTIVAILARPNLRKLVNVPLVSLSCADILFATCDAALWIYHFLHPQWEPPGALCWFESYTTPVLWGVSIGHMLCIALQRYFNVCTYSTRLKSTCVLVIMLSLTWLLPIVSFLPVHVLEEVKVDPKLKRCALGGSANLWGKITPTVLILIIPYIVSLVCYALIHNHVRKSKRRVMANANHHPKRWAVQFSRGTQGGEAGPSTSTTATTHTTRSSRNAYGGVWTGDDNSSSCDDDEQNAVNQNKPGKANHKNIILVTPVPDTTEKPTEKRQHGRGKTPNAKSHNTNAAERQITKMMMTLFAVYTVCCMPMTLMVMVYTKVPSEAFMVASVLMALNGALNPIVYGLMNKNIRQGYKHIWDCVLNYIT